MNKKILAVATTLLVFSGCASVPMESKELTDSAKKFEAPPPGQSNFYIYRYGSFGGALKKDVFIDDECVGETAPNVFFVHEVQGDEDHKVSTESEFSPNDLIIQAKAGMNYFIRQFIKMGVFVGGAGLELVDEEEGKKEVLELEMAKSGTCSQ